MTGALLRDKLFFHIRVIPGMWSLLVEVRPRDGVTGNRKRVCEQRVGNDPADRLRHSLHIKKRPSPAALAAGDDFFRGVFVGATDAGALG